MNAHEENAERYRISKRQVHLDAGWRWLVWDTYRHDYVANAEYEALKDAESAASAWNAGEAPDRKVKS